MKEIKTNRINGYLNLDNYFIKKLKRNYIDLEDLYINGLIDYEPNGLSEKFWVLSGDDGSKIALYKEEAPNSDESYTELLVEEMAKVMEIPAAHYDLAIFDGKKGVISYNFLKEDSVYYSGYDVIFDFYDMRLYENDELSELYNIDYVNDTIEDVGEKLNNLQDIWSILEDRFKDEPKKQKIVKSIMKGLVDKLILDVVAVGIDSHPDNWQIIDKEYASPVFDNSRSLGIYPKSRGINVDGNRKLQDNKLLLTVDNEQINKPLDVLEHFLKISSSEYKDLVVDKVSKLQENIGLIPEKIERRTECKMPEYLKSYFITNMNDHLDKVNEIIYKNKVTRK